MFGLFPLIVGCIVLNVFSALPILIFFGSTEGTHTGDAFDVFHTEMAECSQ